MASAKQMLPTYSISQLSKMLPTANLVQIREIRETMQRERNLYNAGEYVKAFTMLSERLIDLTNEKPRGSR
jgi:hypothetical protein